LTASPEEIQRAFELDETPDLRPRFNVAPGQFIATITADAEGGRSLEMRRWGLVPSWAKDEKIGSRMINARSETAAEKPSFRAAMKKRRCLVPVDGFYEWTPAGAGAKQPHWIARPDRGCFAIAGLWERWKTPDEAWLETCTLLTARASDRLAVIHHRMPVLIEVADRDRWLDPAMTDPKSLMDLLEPSPDDALEYRAVSRRVNRPEHDAPDCIEPSSESRSEPASGSEMASESESESDPDGILF
jgi:putative SOS response-associated peptidase YedK